MERNEEKERKDVCVREGRRGLRVTERKGDKVGRIK